MVRRVLARHLGMLVLVMDNIFTFYVSIFGDSGEKAGLLPRTIEYLFDMIDRNENKSKVEKDIDG